MKDNTRIKVADGLLVLEKGPEELLLANSIDFRPLYIRKGGEYIREFLKAVGELASYKTITKAYPQERSLLNLLLEYRLVVPRECSGQDQRPGNSRGGPQPGKKKSLSLYLLLSQSCNMKCVYCLDGAKTYQTDKGLRMSKEIAFKSIERCLDDIADGGLLEVIFFGGEPLLNWPLAKEVITHCEKCLKEQHKDKQRRYHFTSNLSFLPSDLMEWAKKFNISFLCDIDGPPAIHDLCRPSKDGGGSYESSARNIRLISQAGLKIDLRATVTVWNQEHLLETAELHKAMGGRSTAFIPVNPVNSDESILPETLLPSPEKVIQGATDVFTSNIWKREEIFPFNQYAPRLMPGSVTKLGCGAPYGNIAVVAANGDVYPCIYLVGIKRFHIGSMVDGSYPRMEVLQRMYDDLHVDQREDCKGCSWRYKCGGGCPLGRLTVLNNPAASPPVKTYCKKICCDYTRSILETLLWEKAQETATSHVEDPVRVPGCV